MKRFVLYVLLLALCLPSLVGAAAVVVAEDKPVAETSEAQIAANAPPHHSHHAPVHSDTNKPSMAANTNQHDCCDDEGDNLNHERCCESECHGCSSECGSASAGLVTQTQGWLIPNDSSPLSDYSAWPEPPVNNAIIPPIS